MNLNLRALDWNKYALVTTGFFIVFMVSKVNLLPHCFPIALV